MLDKMDIQIINGLQGGFPVCERPYAEAARSLGLEEGELIARLSRLLESGMLTRFGPMFNADRMGGAFCLCAVAAPEADRERIIAIVNAYPEVAHNYERDHLLNIWFVLATETKERIDDAAKSIEAACGLPVLCFPKIEEYFVGFKMEAAA